MTTEEFRIKLKAIPDYKLAEMARDSVRRLCQTGGRGFTMSVPVRTDDTDIVLIEIIQRFEQLTKD